MLESIAALIAVLVGGALFVGLRKRPPAQKSVDSSPQPFRFQTPPAQAADPIPQPPAPTTMPKLPAMLTRPQLVVVDLKDVAGTTTVNTAPPAAPVVEKVREIVTDDGLTFRGKALDALEAMVNSSQSLFITGKAGTGKSTLLRHFVNLKVKNVAVVAFTGIAAFTARGQTINSFFRFPPKLLTPATLKLPRNTMVYQKLDALIIDEISMVRSDMMDMIDLFLQRARGSSSPFGGVQMILFGDPYQLSPVVSGDEEADYLQHTYGGEFFFNTPGYHQAKVAKIELDHVYRQRDPVFINVLNQMRIGRQTPQHLAILNERYNPLFKPEEDKGCFILTTTNNRVSEINQIRLNELAGRVNIYQAMITGEFNEKKYPTDYELHLKPGAQVMLLRNDPDRRWVNGSIGHIVRLGDLAVTVRLSNPLRREIEVVDVPRESWEDIKYKYNAETDTLVEEVIGSFTQFPIKLSWAMTIHKSQGQTFDRVLIDMDRGAFADGQAYVALSRCRALEGIVLRKQILASDVRVSPCVDAFMNGR